MCNFCTSSKSIGKGRLGIFLGLMGEKNSNQLRTSWTITCVRVAHYAYIIIYTYMYSLASNCGSSPTKPWGESLKVWHLQLSFDARFQFETPLQVSHIPVPDTQTAEPPRLDNTIWIIWYYWFYNHTCIYIYYTQCIYICTHIIHRYLYIYIHTHIIPVYPIIFHDIPSYPVVYLNVGLVDGDPFPRICKFAKSTSGKRIWKMWNLL
jgi:hypothetical protein